MPLQLLLSSIPSPPPPSSNATLALAKYFGNGSLSSASSGRILVSICAFLAVLRMVEKWFVYAAPLDNIANKPIRAARVEKRIARP
jgi:hypothetical protein